MDRLQDLLIGVGSGDDHPAVLGQRLADDIERFLHGGVDEAAGIDHYEIGVVVTRHDGITFGPQLGEDTLTIDQGLGAAKGNKPDLSRTLLEFHAFKK
jgi:hypothetical protein